MRISVKLAPCGELLQAPLAVGEKQRKRERDGGEPREHDVGPQVLHAQAPALNDDEHTRGDCQNEQVSGQ